MNRLNEIVAREVFPGFVGKFVHTDNMTFAYWEIKKGSSLPEHFHFHEQVVNMLEGEFEITLEGNLNKLQPGSTLAIPSNAKQFGMIKNKRASQKCSTMLHKCKMLKRSYILNTATLDERIDNQKMSRKQCQIVASIDSAQLNTLFALNILQMRMSYS